MLEIRRWINILKLLKLNEKAQVDIYKKNMCLFEGILYKIQKIKNDFIEKNILSDYEIEAYSRSINSLILKLVESWEEIVLTALETLKNHLELLVENQSLNLKTVKLTLRCWKKARNEMHDDEKLKPNYQKTKFEKYIWVVNTLEELVIRKYFKKD